MMMGLFDDRGRRAILLTLGVFGTALLLPAAPGECAPEPKLQSLTPQAVLEASESFVLDRSTLQPTPKAAAWSVGKPNSWVASGLSLAVPGLGQLYSGDWLKGVTYLTGTAALYGLSLYGAQQFNPNIGQLSAYGLIGMSLMSPIDAFLSAKNAPSESPKIGEAKAPVLSAKAE